MSEPITRVEALTGLPAHLAWEQAIDLGRCYDRRLFLTRTKPARLLLREFRPATADHIVFVFPLDRILPMLDELADDAKLYLEASDA